MHALHAIHSLHFEDAAKALWELAARSGKHARADRLRGEMLAILRPAFEASRKAIHEEFLHTGDALHCIRQQSALVDTVIASTFQCAGKILTSARSREAKSHLAVVAVGGYGRGELFPYSDIDLLFLHDDKGGADSQHLAEAILYLLWDMGLKVGHATRTIDQTLAVAREDVTICTSLLDARLVCGHGPLYDQCMSRFWAEIVTEDSTLSFVEAKLAERDVHHKKAGDSRYVLEPKIKEGKGGLRDLHMLHWLARYAYRIGHPKELVKLNVLKPQEYRAYIHDHTFLSTVRTYAHLLSGHGEERLTFDLQREIAARMGYRDRGETLAVERFMKAYYLTAKSVGNLSHIFCAVLEDERKHSPRRGFISLLFNPGKLKGFTMDAGRLSAPDSAFFESQPVRLIELFALAERHAVEIHPRTLRRVSRLLPLINAQLRANEEANDLFMEILTSPKQPHITLRLMNEAGVLGKFIPDFGRVVGQMQFDMYHVYTVDEHTIFALSILNKIREGGHTDMPVATRLIHRISSIRTLCLAVLCHDIAKGRGGDHSLLGEKVARKLAQRFRFNEDEVETTAWLVREHLLFSRTAFKRDVTEEKTVSDFVAQVQSPERLRLLLILTVVDIRAVGPQVWNSWKGALLRELYFRAEAKMGVVEEWGDVKSGEFLQPAFTEALPEWSMEERAEYLALGNEQYYRGLDLATHIRIATLLKKAEKSKSRPFALHWSPDEPLAITELLIATTDRKGLFSLVAGALTSIGANIVNAKIFTLKNGMAVEQFFVQDSKAGAFIRQDRMNELEKLLKQALKEGDHVVWEALTLPPRRRENGSFTHHPRVIIENTVSSYHTVIEVNGQDRPGFLFSITRAMAELELSISTAHISSYGERVVDVFYVKDRFGMKIEHDARLKQVREKLLQALGEPAQK